MTVDPSRFQLGNIADTCSVWNVLSSQRLYSTAHQAGATFACTGYVIYECLFKPRRSKKASDEELRSRLLAARRAGDFGSYHLGVADLQTVEILRSRKNLGMGELSSIAFAARTQQAFLTDDQNARRLAQEREMIGPRSVQTTPHLVGWLFYSGWLSDSDKDLIQDEHDSLGRPLRSFFEDMYLEAMRCRLLQAQSERAVEDDG